MSHFRSGVGSVTQERLTNTSTSDSRQYAAMYTATVIVIGMHLAL